MAKAFLTKQAIKFLIDTYDCETSNYTFIEIRNMIIEKFGVTVSSEALRKSYHRNKGNFINNVEPDHKITKPISIKPPVKVFERTEKVQQKNSGFNDGAAESLSKSSINDLLE